MPQIVELASDLSQTLSLELGRGIPLETLRGLLQTRSLIFLECSKRSRATTVVMKPIACCLWVSFTEKLVSQASLQS